ncbi:armadillo-type protein [Phlyctochytrium arcticum]|nr:armadillo-type protein [Phlyctochytrium arcticum]
MDSNLLLSLFSATVQSDQNIRENAENELKRLEAAPGFLPLVLQLLGNNEVDAGIRQAAAIYFKNRLNKGWDLTTTESSITDEDKVFVKQHILSAIAVVPVTLRLQLLACLSRILQCDYANGLWPTFVPDCLNFAKSDSPSTAFVGISGLYEFVTCFQWSNPEKRKCLEVFLEKGLPILQTVAAKYALSDDPETATLLHLILKTYNASIRLSLSPQHQLNSSLVPWGTLFVQVVEKPIRMDAPYMPEDEGERESHPWWKAKKWAYTCLNTLFERYARAPEKRYKTFSAVFTEHFAPNILTAYLKQLELLVSGVWMTGRVKQRLAEFLRSCIKPLKMWNMIKDHLEPIVMRFIFPLLCFSNEDKCLWEEDPVEYVHKKLENPMEEFRSPVYAAETLLFELAKLRPKTFIPLVTLINNALSRYESAKPEERNYVEKEGALKMMSCLAVPALSPRSPIRDHLETFIAVNVIPELASTHGFLKSRACELLIAFEDLEYRNEANLQNALNGVLRCLVDGELPVRVSAALALRVFLKNPTTHDALKPHIQPIIQTMMNLTNELDMESLTQILESLVADFSEELEPFAVQLAQQLCDTFLRLIHEVNNDQEEFALDDALEEKTAASQGVLRTLCTLVLAMESSLQITANLEVVVAPAVKYVLQHNILDLYEEVFEIIETATFCSKAISPTIWELWPLVYTAFKNDAVDYIDEMANCLENYVSYGKDIFAQSVTHREQMVDIISTVLTMVDNEMLSDSNRCRACDLIEAMLLNLRGHVDVYISRFVNMALAYIDTPARMKKPGFRVRCLEVVVNCILYNPAETILLLEQRGATTGFFSYWLTHIDEFKRVHDKKLCILSILSILELPPSKLPASLTEAAWLQLYVSLLSVFQSYPQALKAREEEEKMYTEGLGQGEEDDEDEFGSFFKDSLDDDTDVQDEDDQYLEMLANKTASAGEDVESDDEDVDDDWDVEELEEDMFFTTPLDTVDAYVEFKRAMEALGTDANKATLLAQKLNDEQKAFVQTLMSPTRQ